MNNQSKKKSIDDEIPFVETTIEKNKPEIYREIIPEISPEVPEAEPLTHTNPYNPDLPPYQSCTSKASGLVDSSEIW